MLANFFDAVVLRVRDVDVARRVHGDAVGAVEVRAGGGAGGWGASAPGAGEEGECATGGDLFDAAVVVVRDVDVA